MIIYIVYPTFNDTLLCTKSLPAQIMCVYIPETLAAQQSNHYIATKVSEGKLEPISTIMPEEKLFFIFIFSFSADISNPGQHQVQRSICTLYTFVNRPTNTTIYQNLQPHRQLATVYLLYTPPLCQIFFAKHQQNIPVPKMLLLSNRILDLGNFLCQTAQQYLYIRVYLQILTANCLTKHY